MTVSYMGEITVSLSSLPLISTVPDNYDFSPISRIVKVDRGQVLITEVFLRIPVTTSVGNNSLTSEGATANNTAKKAEKSIDTWDTAISKRQFPSCVSHTPEVQPLTVAKKKRIIDILKNCHSSMAKNDKLLLLTTVITNSVAPNNQQPSSKWLDLAMFFMTGGRERRETEYQKLLAIAGFKLTKIIHTQSLISAIEAVKI